MASPQEKLQEVVEKTHGKLDRLLSTILEAEVDHTALESLRDQLKKWIDMQKDDCLTHFAMHQIGHGYKWKYDTEDKLRQSGNNIDPALKIQLNKQLVEADKKINHITQLALEMERNGQAGVNLRQEVKNWIDGLSPDYLLFFAQHFVGVGLLFAKYVEGKAQQVPAE